MFKVESSKGSVNIVKDNFVYRAFGILKSGEERWRCNVKSCRAWLYTLDDGDLFSRQDGQHNHEPREDSRIWRNTITTSLKRKAVDDIDDKPSKLVHKELSGNSPALDSLTRRDVICIRNNITKARLKKFPKLPKSSLEVQEALAVMEIKTAKNEQFLIANDTTKGIVVFACESNLKNLCDLDVVLMDGTFEYAPKYFTQLFTIHGFRDGVYVPLVYCLLPNKKLETYTQVLNMVKEACQSRKLHFQPSAAVVDFEQAIHQSLQEVFPDTNIVGCRFHLGQAWWRKIQSLGLSSIYKDKDSVEGKWLHYCFGLTYLSPEDVEEAFLQLVSIQPSSPKITSFCDYLTETYIDKASAIFPPQIWASCTAALWRTTNACESFHARFNKECSSPHPNVYMFLKNLKSMQTDAYVRLNSTEVPKSRKKTCERMDFLVKKIDQLKNKTIDILTFTKCVGYKNLPINAC